MVTISRRKLELFGSVLDLKEFLFPKKISNYRDAIKRVTQIWESIGLNPMGKEQPCERQFQRARNYLETGLTYFLEYLIPKLRDQLLQLIALDSSLREVYSTCLQDLDRTECNFRNTEWLKIIFDDPRNVHLLAALKREPKVFVGHPDISSEMPSHFQSMACALLKSAHLVKSLEEDSRSIHEFSELGFFFRQKKIPLDNLYSMDWQNAEYIPLEENARRAYIKLTTFFGSLKKYITYDEENECLILLDYSGQPIQISEIKARIKAPESMISKMGRSIEERSQNIADPFAVSFILKNKVDTLRFYLTLQDHGIVSQEAVDSASIKQTLFASSEDMKKAVQIAFPRATPQEILKYSEDCFAHFKKNSTNNDREKQRKIQFKLALPIAVCYNESVDSRKSIIPGTRTFEQARLGKIPYHTRNENLEMELRISNDEDWHISEFQGSNCHKAFKFRQLLRVARRLFGDNFSFDFSQHQDQLELDQALLFVNYDLRHNFKRIFNDQ